MEVQEIMWKINLVRYHNQDYPPKKQKKKKNLIFC